MGLSTCLNRAGSAAIRVVGCPADSAHGFAGRQARLHALVGFAILGRDGLDLDFHGDLEHVYVGPIRGHDLDTELGPQVDHLGGWGGYREADPLRRDRGCEFAAVSRTRNRPRRLFRTWPALR